MIEVQISVKFPAGPECGYVAEPFRPEMSEYINVTKESGMNRARSTANRRKALEEHLISIGRDLAWFEALERRAKEPYDFDADGFIIIPRRNVAAFLVATCDTLRSASRPCPPDQVRSRIGFTPLTTDKRQGDGVYSRFATVTAGTGAKLSNQRALRESHYITDFTAVGTLTFSPEFVDPDTLRKAIEWGGRHVGMGAARKMGWGRFGLVGFDVLDTVEDILPVA